MRYTAQVMAVAVLLLLGLPLSSRAAPPQDVFDDEVPPPARPQTGSQPRPAPVPGVSRLRRFQRDRRVVTPDDMRPARPYSGGKPSQPPVSGGSAPEPPLPEPPVPQPVPVTQPSPTPQLPPAPAVWVAVALPWSPVVGQPGLWWQPIDTVRPVTSGRRAVALALREAPPVPEDSGPVVSEVRPPASGRAPVAVTVEPETGVVRTDTGAASTVLVPTPEGPGSKPSRSVMTPDREPEPRVARVEPSAADAVVDSRLVPKELPPSSDEAEELPPPSPALPLRSPRPVAAVVERAPPAPPPAPPVPRREAVVPADALAVKVLPTSAESPAPASGAGRRPATDNVRGLPSARVVARSQPVRVSSGRPFSAEASGRSTVTARLSWAEAKALSGVPLPALARPAAGAAPETAAPVQRVVLASALQPTILMPARPRMVALGILASNVSVGRITVSLPLGRHQREPIVAAMMVVPPLLVVSPLGRMDRLSMGPWPMAFAELSAGAAALALSPEAMLLPRSVAPMGLRRGILAPATGSRDRRRQLPQRFRGAPGTPSRPAPESPPPSVQPPESPADSDPRPVVEPPPEAGVEELPGPSGPAPETGRRARGR